MSGVPRCARRNRAAGGGHDGYPVIDAAMRQMNMLCWHAQPRPYDRRQLLDQRPPHLLAARRPALHAAPDSMAISLLRIKTAVGSGRRERHFMHSRISYFNSISQSEQYDPEGEHLRLCAQLALCADYIHAPWTLPTPPNDYPSPMVEHSAARQRTLAAFKKVKTMKRVTAHSDCAADTGVHRPISDSHADHRADPLYLR